MINDSCMINYVSDSNANEVQGFRYPMRILISKSIYGTHIRYAMYKAKENKNHPNAQEHTHTHTHTLLNLHLKYLVGLLSSFN